MDYTLEEANKLHFYYTKELVGKYVDDEKGFKITEIEINETKDNKNRYELQATTSMTNDNSFNPFIRFAEISNAAKLFGLPSPEEILSKK
jgi:hypothetical protein